MKKYVEHNSFSGSFNYDYFKDDITIVIPVLNEEEAIGKLLPLIREEGYTNILVVDGYSNDKTYDIASNYCETVIFQKGEGKTGAIKTAINLIETSFILIMDGDCTYHPQDIKNFYPKILSHDQVIGTRLSGRTNIPFFNRFGNWVINVLFNLVYGTNLVDVCSGMYALQTQFAKKLRLETKGFDLEVEIAAQASRKGNISEVPIYYYPRVGKQKLQPVKDGFKIIYRIIRNARLR